MVGLKVKISVELDNRWLNREIQAANIVYRFTGKGYWVTMGDVYINVERICLL